VEITHGALEKQSSNPGENRIAQVTVQRRHGAWQNSAPKPVPHYQVVSFPQLVDEQVGLREIVAVRRHRPSG